MEEQNSRTRVGQQIKILERLQHISDGQTDMVKPVYPPTTSLQGV